MVFSHSMSCDSSVCMPWFLISIENKIKAFWSTRICLLFPLPSPPACPCGARVCLAPRAVGVACSARLSHLLRGLRPPFRHHRQADSSQSLCVSEHLSWKQSPSAHRGLFNLMLSALTRQDVSFRWQHFHVSSHFKLTRNLSNAGSVQGTALGFIGIILDLTSVP